MSAQALTLTPAQMRVIDDIRTKRVESRQSRRDGSYYWTANDKRYSAATNRMIDRLQDAGIVQTRREEVKVVGMNVPRKAWVAYDTLNIGIE